MAAWFRVADATRWFAIVIAVAIWASACGGKEEAAGEAASQLEEAAPPAPPSAEPGLAEKLKAEMKAKAERKKAKEILGELESLEGGELSALVEAVNDFLEFRFRNERAYYTKYMEEFDRKMGARRAFAGQLKEIYAAAEYGLLFHDFSARVPSLSPAGQALLSLLKEMPSHGLEAEDYRLESLQKQLDWFAKAQEEFSKAAEGEFGARERQFWDLLAAYKELPQTLELTRDLKKAGYTNDDAVAVQNFQVYYKAVLDAKFKLNEAAAEVDLDLLAGFFQAMLDFKYVIRAHPFKGGSGKDSAADFKDALRMDWQSAGGDPAAYILGLIPGNPTYLGLREGLALYQRLKDDPEVAKLKIKRELKPGAKGEAVQLLTKRLAMEGYLGPEQVSDRYSNTVTAAVKLYQQTHQMEEDGAVGRLTRKSLNVSMDRRFKSVKLGLQRWRESDIHRDRPAIFVRVNIPQFEAEIWDNNVLARVHKVVVGNRNEEVSVQRKQRGVFNHTALLKSRIETVVLNPKWFPPPRIQEELLKDLEREPDYFEKNNFGVVQHDDGSETVFQKPGPSNALGLVKFLFPNDANVYMHDTPMKKYFDRPVRAYSHGCMRTQKPLELAKYLLGNFAGTDEERMQEILKSEKESYIKLDPPLPIFVEYCTVGVDPEGRIRFFIDIYGYDKAYWDRQLPVQLTEDLSEWELKRLAGKAAEETPAQDGEEAEAGEIDPE
jgi:murein L,D-transpeptidase YcbB/YkuD